MYIAFKWLVCMALAMWIILCIIDLYLKKYKIKELPGYYVHEFSIPSDENTSLFENKNILYETKETVNVRNNALLQYIMFFAGACIVSIFHNKQNIILYTKRKIDLINIEVVKANLLNHKYFKCPAMICVVALSKNLCTTIGRFSIKILKKLRISSFCTLKLRQNCQNVNILLLQKLKEFGQERRNLGHLLIAAIQENKNIRMRYQLELMAKNRLVRYIEETQRHMKENRSQYVSFQQLYLVTHQENIFLKSRLKRLSKEKEDAERNLIKLVHQVCQSKNNELKAYCSRFLVHTKNNLLNSDVKAEIQKFLKKSCQLESNKKEDYSDTNTINFPFYVQPTESIDDENLVALVKDAPKLRGLPGEYVWTIKDKDGMIEKLYEYETEFDNGDTIRRIREYSVYYDKDCLLDFSKSSTLMHNLHSDNIHVECVLNGQKFLTGSPAFQKFLKSNKNIVSNPHHSYSLLC